MCVFDRRAAHDCKSGDSLGHEEAPGRQESEVNRCPDFVIRPARSGDEPGAYHVCLKTGDHGRDGEPFYREDPDALGRIYVGPYLRSSPSSSLILEDEQGICGYALGALDSRAFYARYETEWRPDLCARFPRPAAIPPAGPVQQVHHGYHHPDYFCPEPYEAYPSHLHIDLLPRAQGRGLRPAHDGAGRWTRSRDAVRPASTSA